MAFNSTFHSIRSNLMKNNYFTPSHDKLTSTLTGLVDYGIMGLQLKNRIVDVWTKQYVTLDVWQIESTELVPASLIETTLFKQNLVDWVLVDDSNQTHNPYEWVKNWFRDHKMEVQVAKVDSMTRTMLEQCVRRYKMLNNLQEIIRPRPRMISVGTDHWLRCELSFGVMSQLKKLTHWTNNINNPFGLAQIGRTYRLINSEPCTQLEASVFYFYDPLNQPIELINNLSGQSILISTRAVPEMTAISFDTILLQDLIDVQTLNCIGRAIEFMNRINIPIQKLRLVEIPLKDLAHYSVVIWVLEVGHQSMWVRCIEFIQRGTYDLQMWRMYDNSNEIIFKRQLTKPQITTVYQPIYNIELLTERYPTMTDQIIEHYNGLSQLELADAKNTLERNNRTLYLCLDNHICTLANQMVSVVKKDMKITSEDYVPHVLEVRYNLDLVMLMTLEHSIGMTDGRTKLFLPKQLVPYQLMILLEGSESIIPFKHSLQNIRNDMKAIGVNVLVRDMVTTNPEPEYARCDELGISYSVYLSIKLINEKSISFRSLNGQAKKINQSDLTQALMAN